MLYFIERDFGKNGKAFIECDRDTNDRKQIIKDIQDGQHEHVIKVLEIDEEYGRCRDVTAEILEEAGIDVVPHLTRRPRSIHARNLLGAA